MSGSSVAVNTRVLTGSLTGVQRYLGSLLAHMPFGIDKVAPQASAHGLHGHLWEQAALPVKVRGRLLFSPANTGPLAVRRQVVTIHDVAALDHPERLNPKFAAWYRFMTPRLARRVARVITISEYSKQRLLAHVPMDERRVVVIPNGVDERFAPQNEAAIGSMRNELGLPKGRYVLCVGTLEPRKNIPRLLQAWSRIIGRIPDDVGLVLTGKQGQRELFARMAGVGALPSRVHLTGHVAETLLPAVYAGALAFVFPSLYEGFGLPPLEAMACGVPVLTGNLTSLPEVVGEAGLMVDPTSVDAIADGLLRLIQDDSLRQALIAKGLARAALFSWDEAAQKTWSVLQEALDS